VEDHNKKDISLEINILKLENMIMYLMWMMSQDILKLFLSMMVQIHSKQLKDIVPEKVYQRDILNKSENS
jgi:hypothetical protein